MIVALGVAGALVLCIAWQVVWARVVGRGQPERMRRVCRQALQAGFEGETVLKGTDRRGREVTFWVGQSSRDGQAHWEFVEEGAPAIRAHAWVELTWHLDEPLLEYAVYRRDLFSGIGGGHEVGWGFALRYDFRDGDKNRRSARRLRRLAPAILEAAPSRIYSRSHEHRNGTTCRQLAILADLRRCDLPALLRLGETLVDISPSTPPPAPYR